MLARDDLKAPYPTVRVWKEKFQPRTSMMGVSFKIFARIFRTVSPSPVTQTLVTKPFGRRCSDGEALGSEVVNEASTRPPLLSVICRHNLCKPSTLLVCTGSWCTGVPSGVPSGNVQRCRAPGLAWSTSSTSGPAKAAENGMLKDKLTVGSILVGGVIGGAPCGRRKAMSV